MIVICISTQEKQEDSVHGRLPDDFVFCGAQNSWYAQIGNAVPVKLAEAIGRGIMKFVK